MGDLKTFWDNPGMPTQTDLGGDSVTASGSDPSVDTEGTSAMTPLGWTNPSVPTPDGSESPNSVSGLPDRPNRFEPSATPPEPPTLQDRRPGTIDEQ
jgi:hypothetical protein